MSWKKPWQAAGARVAAGEAAALPAEEEVEVAEEAREGEEATTI